MNLARKIGGLAAVTVALATGCERKAEYVGPSAGERLLRLEAAAVSGIVFARAGSFSGPSFASWSVEVAREGATWRLVSFPGSIADRLADGKMIDHWLDLLSELKIASLPDCFERARCQPLSRFGIEPPVWAFRWSAGGVSGELRLGEPASPRGRYAWAPGLGDRVWVIDGAFLAFLEDMAGPESLRHARLATFSKDDVDEIRVEESGTVREFRREGGNRWSERGGRTGGAPRSLDVAAWLERVAHLRIREFEAPEGQGRPRMSVELRGRRLDPVRLRLHDGDLASLGSRPGSWFRLHPGAVGSVSLARFR